MQRGQSWPLLPQEDDRSAPLSTPHRSQSCPYQAQHSLQGRPGVVEGVSAVVEWRVLPCPIRLPPKVGHDI